MGKRRAAAGIDFGTSTTLVTEPLAGTATVVPIGRAAPWMPSEVGLDGERLVVGEDAAELGAMRRQSIKNAISRPGMAQELSLEEHSAQELIVSALREARARAEKSLRGDLSYVFGCPAMWTGSQRRELAELAAQAGLNTDVDRIIDEPIAAGLAWIQARSTGDSGSIEGTVLVVDLGGGTVDASLLEVAGGTQVTVFASNGRTLAGDDVDRRVARRLLTILDDAGADHGVTRSQAFADFLGREARRIKEALSRQTSVKAVFPRAFGSLPPVAVTRATLETELVELLDSATQTALNVLREASLHAPGADIDSAYGASTADLASRVDHVLLTGGMALTPAVQQRFREIFPDASIHAPRDLTEATTLVAQGLSSSAVDHYETINAHRPSFDVVIRWTERGTTMEETIFEAYTPLYDWIDILTRKRPLGTVFGQSRMPSDSCSGELILRSIGGTTYGRSHDGGSVSRTAAIHLDGFTPVTVCLRVNGDVIAYDSQGRMHAFNVPHMPTPWFAAQDRPVIHTISPRWDSHSPGHPHK